MNRFFVQQNLQRRFKSVKPLLNPLYDFLVTFVSCKRLLCLHVNHILKKNISGVLRGVIYFRQLNIFHAIRFRKLCFPFCRKIRSYKFSFLIRTFKSIIIIPCNPNAIAILTNPIRPLSVILFRFKSFILT